jgi:hypothetical protein
LDNPGQEDSPVASAIIRRILLQRTDLLSKYGPERVGAAVDDVADSVGDWDEIGSSDVSGWVRRVEQMLGNMSEQSVTEGSEEQMAEQTLQKLVSFARDNPTTTMAQLASSPLKNRITAALSACDLLIRSYTNAKQLGNAEFVRQLKHEINYFLTEKPPASSDPLDFGDLLTGKLGKINFDQGVAEGDIGQLEKDVADAPVEPIANMEAQEKIGGRHDADDFDDMVLRLKKLAGAGSMKTVWDPARRQYRNMPTAVQPPQQPKK